MTDTARPIAVVTGATGGMGSEIVRELARTHTVHAIGRRTDALAALEGEHVRAHRIDLADAEALAAFGAGLRRVDVLRIDEERNRIRVATLAPGQTDTAMLRAMTPDDAYAPERYIRPETVAGAVRALVELPADAHITDLALRPRQEIARL